MSSQASLIIYAKCIQIVKDAPKIIVTESIMFKNFLTARTRHDELNNMTVHTGSNAILIKFFKIYNVFHFCQWKF
jgi:hypothetical protein